jgi:2-polyprenyl-6-methoxyphenol hydroxylase-like FAD-dependent oxidoreductase
VIVQDIVWGSRFRIYHGVADRFHTGRVALAGDAAHDNSPLGGQGMNAGIGDATALAAALDAAIERGSPARLDAYTATRRPIARQIVTLTNGLTRLATMDRQLRTARNAALATLNPFLSRPPGTAALPPGLPLIARPPRSAPKARQRNTRDAKSWRPAAARNLALLAQ